MLPVRVLSLCAAIVAACRVAVASPVNGVVFATALTEPVAISSPPGDSTHVVVCELPGRLIVLSTTTGAVRSEPLLDIRPLVSEFGDGGLLGFAFDPQFQTNGWVYLFYNALPSPQDDRVLARYTVNPATLVADPASGVTIWRYSRSIGHNGGWIGFSPANGFLYLSSGDGGTAFTAPDIPNRAQNIINEVQGKVLRIDVRGDDFPGDPLRNFRIPPSNPFVGITGDDEIWALGVRNPWRCAFDRLTGDFYIADVGQSDWEEINYEPMGSPGGRNYGWKCMEGNHCTGFDGGAGCVCFAGNMTLPIFEYGHTTGRSITGGIVYRGGAIPQWQGRYFFADFEVARVWSVRVVQGVATDLREHTDELRSGPPGTPSISWISAFGEDHAGEMYLCDYIGGTIYKVSPNPCQGDFNDIGGVTVQDIFDFLDAWFSMASVADFNYSGIISVEDIFDFLDSWFQGC